MTRRTDLNAFGVYIFGRNVKALAVELPVKLNSYISLAPAYIYALAPPIAARP